MKKRNIVIGIIVGAIALVTGAVLVKKASDALDEEFASAGYMD